MKLLFPLVGPPVRIIIIAYMTLLVFVFSWSIRTESVNVGVLLTIYRYIICIAAPTLAR